MQVPGWLLITRQLKILKSFLNSYIVRPRELINHTEINQWMVVKMAAPTKQKLLVRRHETTEPDMASMVHCPLHT